MFVNVPGKPPGMPELRPITLISSLPGITSHAAYLGLNGKPVIHGRVDLSFETNSVNGSLDGEWYRQDRLTVLAGRLPPLGSTSEAMVTPAIARLFGARPGGRVTYAFRRVGPEGVPAGPQYTRSYRVAAIVEVPPALVDQSDQAEGSILPPGTTRQLLADYVYAWVGLRLDNGAAGIPALQHHLAELASALQQEGLKAHHEITGLSFPINRPDVVHSQVQQSIRPEGIALSVFAVVAALAMLVLVGQGLAQMISRSAADLAVIRALGAPPCACRAGREPARGGPGGGRRGPGRGRSDSALTARAGRAVRRFDPVRGAQADWLILGPGALLMGVLLCGLLALLAIRSVRRRANQAAGHPSLIAGTAAAAGLPASAVIGSRNALEPGSGTRSVPVRSTLAGSIAAVVAVVSAAVFGASLTGLISHPARYGWNWNVLIQAEGGYGSFTPGVMKRLIRGQPAVAGWSELAFSQLAVDGRVVPVLGIRRDLGVVQPPTTSGRPLSGPDQIELGTATLGQLGKRVGDSVTIGTAPFTRTVTIAGTVTLPSFGLTTADHVSLGRGAMLPEATLLTAESATGAHAKTGAQAQPSLPSAVAIDLAPGTTAAQRAQLVHRIVSANPDRTPGGTYEVRHALAATIVNTEQMGGQPVVLALGLAGPSACSARARRARHPADDRVHARGARPGPDRGRAGGAGAGRLRPDAAACARDRSRADHARPAAARRPVPARRRAGAR